MTTDVERARTKLADFCQRSIAAASEWDYTQARPMSGLGVPPEKPHWNDCSGHATLAYYWAGAPDPNSRNYDGSGYTGTLLAENDRAHSPYQVGDLALYGESSSRTTHVVTCHRAGDSRMSSWTSHGSASGPYAVRLFYRDDLLTVVRPTLGTGADDGKGEPVQAWVPDWLQWYVFDQHHDPPAPRPPDAPRSIPASVWDLEKQVVSMLKQQGANACYQDWRDWYGSGRLPEMRPTCAPKTVYPEWWEARNRDL